MNNIGQSLKYFPKLRTLKLYFNNAYLGKNQLNMKFLTEIFLHLA